MEAFGIDRLKRDRDALNALFGLSKEVQKSLLDKLDKEFIAVFIELAKNVITGTVDLDKSQFERLRRYRDLLKELTRPSPAASIERKKEIIQRGGVFNAVVGPYLQMTQSSSRIRKKRAPKRVVPFY